MTSKQHQHTLSSFFFFLEGCGVQDGAVPGTCSLARCLAEIVTACPALLSNASLETEKKLPGEVDSIVRDRRGTDVKLIMEKELTTSDMSRNLGQHSVPRSMILADFLQQDELLDLDNRGEITVPVVEPCLRISNLTLKSWAPFYALTRGWNAVAHEENNGLKAGDLIQLWSFRTGGSLVFAVVKA